MNPIDFFSTSNRKKVAAYLIEKGNHVATFKEVEKQTGVMYRTLRDILTRAEEAGFIRKKPVSSERSKGIRIELAKPMLDSMDQIREACIPPASDAGISKEDVAIAELKQLSNTDYEQMWPKLYEIGWTAGLTECLVKRLSGRGISVGGVKHSFDHMEFILANSSFNKTNEELLMNFFRSLDDKGYVAIPPGFVPDDVAKILGND